MEISPFPPPELPISLLVGLGSSRRWLWERVITLLVLSIETVFKRNTKISARIQGGDFPSSEAKYR
jgi:hypothetical protein